MIRYTIRRLLMAIPVVFAVATLTFFLMKLSPGDPATAALGDKATPEAVAALQHAWGLDQPVLVQYAKFIGELATGNLGVSYLYQAPVTELLAGHLPATLMLIVLAAVFAVVISLPLAIWMAVSRSSIPTTVVGVLNAILQGMPTFLVGMLLMIALGLQLAIFPVGGFGDTWPEHLHSLVLPSLSVALAIVPLLVRSLSTSLKESLEAEYVNFARAKGLSHRRVLFDSALRNGSISGISILGIQIGTLVGGALIVENVFAIPGMGSLLLEAVLKRDYVVVQASTVVFGVIVVIVYLLTDLAYGWLDPRARKRG